MNQEINKILHRSNLALLLAVVVLVFSLGASLLLLSERKEIITCASLGTYSAALKALPKHPSLDRDHDGVPCKSLYKKNNS